MTRGDFLEIGHFAPFSQFLHIKGRNFPDVFIRSRLPMTPVNHEKFHGNWSAHVEKSGRQTQTDRRSNFICIDTFIQTVMCYVIMTRLVKLCVRMCSVFLSGRQYT